MPPVSARGYRANLVATNRQTPCAWSSLPAAANRRRSLATGPWPARRAWSNASAGATSWRCCRGLSLRQWMSWLRTRLRSRTLLRLQRHLGGLRRGLNGRSGHGSARMFLIMLHSGLCRLRLRRAGTRARRR